MTLLHTSAAGLMIFATLAAGAVHAQTLPNVATPIITGGPIVGAELTVVWGAVAGADEYAIRIEAGTGATLDARVFPAGANCDASSVCTLIIDIGDLPPGRGQWAIQVTQAGIAGAWSRWQAFTLASLERAAGLAETASNTSVGNGALASNAGGVGNSGLGLNALTGNIGGNYNTASGHNALTYNSWGSWNTATGTGALQNNTSGALNVAVGGQALSSNATGSWNTAIGTNSLLSNLASYNTAVGGQALLNNVNGVGNTATGMNAIASNNGGNYNTGTGYNALSSNVWGSWNTGMGAGALQQVTSGTLNVAVGGQALATVTTGFRNTAVGTNTLVNSIGSYSTAVGYNALSLNTSGNINTALGQSALRDNRTGGANTAVGDSAMLLSTGDFNAALGYLAGYQATGDFNVFLGASAGSNVLAGSLNIEIGNTGSNGDAGVIRIGNAPNHTQTYIAGIHGVTSSSGTAVFINASGQLGTVSSSARFKDQIASLDGLSARVQALRPVRFVYKPGVDDGSRVTQYGLIAEEVAAVIPDLVVRDEHGEAQTVRYHFLPPLLLAEVQRLERERIAQAREIAELRAMIEALTAPRRQ